MTHIDEYLVGQRNFQTIKQIKSWVEFPGLGLIRRVVLHFYAAFFVQQLLVQQFICAWIITIVENSVICKII